MRPQYDNERIDPQVITARPTCSDLEAIVFSKHGCTSAEKDQMRAHDSIIIRVRERGPYRQTLRQSL